MVTRNEYADCAKTSNSGQHLNEQGFWRGRTESGGGRGQSPPIFMSVQNLIIPGNYTPQQLLVALGELVDDIDSIALCFRWKKDGAYQCSWTTMDKEEVLMAFAVGSDKVMGIMRGEKRIERYDDDD